jgi:hypothetical protein
MLDSISLDRIQIDGGTQPREYLNELVISDYTEAMADGADFPPLVVFFDGSQYWLADGFHRFFAAKKQGITSLAAEVRQGTRRDAVLYAAGANATHGLRRTNADKRRAVLTLLKDDEWQRWHNREIARRCGVTHPFVSKLRQELLGANQNAVPPREAATSSARREPKGDGPFLSPSGETLDVNSDARPAAAASPGGASVYEATWDLTPDIESMPVTESMTPPRRQTARDIWDEPDEADETVDLPPAPVSVSRPAPARTGARKPTIDEVAGASQQTPVEWVAEMMVYWLLDLRNQYEGVTPDLVQQAAARLLPQYERASGDLPSPADTAG